MNDKFTTNNREEEIAEKLQRVAKQTNLNSQFAAELEARLRNAHQPKASWFGAFFQRVSPTVVWVALMVLLALVLSLSINTLIPAPQPAAKGTTIATDKLAPAAIPTLTPQAPFEYTVEEGDTCGGIAALFKVSVQSIITLNNLPSDCILRVGQILKIPYPALTPVPPPTNLPDGESFDYNGAKLILSVPLPDAPRQAGVYHLREPQPATVEQVQALADQFGIRGDVYITRGRTEDKSAFMVSDGKQQLIVYMDNDYTYTSDMVKNSRNRDGFQNENAEATIREYLSAHGLDFNLRFDPGNQSSYTLEQLTSDGAPLHYAFNNGPEMRITLDEEGNILSVSSVLMKYDATPLGEYSLISAEEALKRLLDENLPAGRIDTGYNSSQNPNFVLPKTWYHDYPNDQTVTVYGEVSTNQAVDTTKPAMVFLDNVATIGNNQGMEKLSDYTFALATGQFVVEDGIRKFNVDTWDAPPSLSFVGSAHREGDQIIAEDQEGAKYILVDPPADLPLDLQLPEALYFRAAAVDGKLYWVILQYIEDIDHMGGGGGGGGGMSFYRLNLSSTPVPFPTSTPVGKTYSRAELASFLRHIVQPDDTLAQIAETYHVSMEDLMAVNHMTDSTVATGWELTIPGVPGPTRLDGERGVVQVQLFEKPDGRQRAQYTFISEKDRYFSYELRGETLEPLQKAVNRPIQVWGGIRVDEAGNTFVDVEKFEILYPDLQFQILKGTQESKEIDGAHVNLFTTGGTTYVELAMSGGYPNEGYADVTGDVTVEALQVPEETYAGYPAIRVYNLLPTRINPQTGEPYELAPIADRLEAVPDPFGNADQFVPPDVIIDKVELVYVANDSYEPDVQSDTAPERYIQPAWRFHGQMTDGGETDILIQALEQKYLLPETLP